MKLELDYQEKINKFIKASHEIDLDKSHLELPLLPNFQPHRIFIRDCYQDLQKIIMNNTTHTRFLITGNPGVGKTLFGQWILA